MGSLARKWQEEGKAEGLLEGKKEAARAMLAKGTDLNFTKEVTKLTPEEIDQLKTDLNIH